MKTVTIKRMYTPWATVGDVLLYDGRTQVALWSLELPWLNNRRSVSCIPEGIYTCKKYSSPKYKDTYIVQGVPERTHILFHKGNTTADTEGCILLGSAGMIAENRIKIIQSGVAFRCFMSFIGDDEEFELIILPYLAEYP